MEIFGPLLGGEPGYGEAPDGTLAVPAGGAGRPRGSPFEFRFGSNGETATPAQAVRYAATTAQANAAMRRVREEYPDWKPTPSLYDGIEGAIAHNRAIVSEARLKLFGRSGRDFEPAPFHVVLLPGGQPVGYILPGAGRDIRTVDHQTFHNILEALLPSSREIAQPLKYPGIWYQRPDQTTFGLRYSRQHGLTFEVFFSHEVFIQRNFKVHAR